MQCLLLINFFLYFACIIIAILAYASSQLFFKIFTLTLSAVPCCT